MAVCAPILAQQMKSRLRQRDIAVLGALAAVDMDHHALAVDIGDFAMEAFVKPQPRSTRWKDRRGCERF
jgi:hypothetical protein